MKSFFALCFLAAICAMQASANNPLDQLKDAVESIKNNVMSTIANIGGLRHNLIISAQQNMDTLRKRSSTNIENMVRPALDEIRIRVDQANAGGKDAEHCYATIQDGVHNILGTTSVGLRTCHRNGRMQLQQAFAPLDVEMDTGHMFIVELDNIFPECYNSNTTEMQACIVKRMEQINESIRAYQTQANEIITYAQNGLNNATNTVSSCIMGPEEAARCAITELRKNANQCILK